MRVNPFADSWLFLIGEQGDQVSLGAWRWFFVALFLALVFAKLALAESNLRADAEQRRGSELVMWLLRTLVGMMWFQGILWKLPLFSTNNGLYFWTKQMAEFAALELHLPCWLDGTVQCSIGRPQPRSRRMATPARGQSWRPQ
jgi:hypothetical protein